MDGERQKLGTLLDRWWSPALFFAALGFLVVLAGTSHRLKDQLITDFEIQLLVGGLAVLWPLFLIEAVVRFIYYPEPNVWRRAGYSFLLLLLPPLHLGSKGYTRTNELWLPALGWQMVDKHLRRRLEQFFSVPMIALALLTLPLIVIEYYWQDQITSSATLSFIADIGTSFIWLAFAVEFILMVSVAEKKPQYMLRHWVDLLIVLLPLIEVLPALRSVRAFQALRMQQLTKLGRAYRMRAVAMKLWRAMLVLKLIQRLTGATPEKRLRRLQELLRAKEEEVAELREEIDKLRQECESKGITLAKGDSMEEATPATAAAPPAAVSPPTL